MQYHQTREKWITATIAGLCVFFVMLSLLILPDINIESINEILLQFPGLDKILHFFEHCAIVLGIYYLLGNTRLKKKKRWRLLVALATSITFSLTDEFHQKYISGRSFEIEDLFANTLGSLTGIALLYPLERKPVLRKALLTTLFLSLCLITYSSYTKQKPYYTGMQLQKNRQFKLARKQYIKAIKAGNTSGGLYNSIAWLDLEYLKGDPGQALYYAQKAFEQNMNNADYLDTYGWALLQVNRPLESINYLESAYKINPDMSCIELHLGSAYLALGKTDKAFYHLTRQIKKSPSNRFGLQAQATLKTMREKGTDEPIR
jgi:VanZ family protein